MAAMRDAATSWPSESARSWAAAAPPGNGSPTQARISLSTLEKGLAGQRRFTTATLVRIEAALGVALRPHARPSTKRSAATSRRPSSAPMRGRRCNGWRATI